MSKFISKGEWFDKDTEVTPIWIDEDIGLFKGLRTCINPKSEAHLLGEQYEDEEMCGLDEFEVIE